MMLGVVGRHRRRPRACTGACAGSSAGRRPLARADLWLAGLATFVVGGGSALLYEASRPWVYHEAAVWGAAWSIAAIDAAVGCVTQPSRRRFVWAALTTALALTSRSSVGLGGRRRPRDPRAAATSSPGSASVAPVPRPTGWPGGCAPFRSLSGAPDRDRAPAGARAGPRRRRARRRLRRHQLDQVPHAVLDPVLGAGVHDRRTRCARRSSRRTTGRCSASSSCPPRWCTTSDPTPSPSPARSRSSTSRPRPRPSAASSSTWSTTRAACPSSMPALTVLAIVGIVVMFRRSDRAPGTGVSALAGSHARRPGRSAHHPALRLHREPLPRGRACPCWSSPASSVCTAPGRLARGRARRRRRLPWIGAGRAGARRAVGQPVPRAALPAPLQPRTSRTTSWRAFIDTRFDVGQSARARPADPDHAGRRYDDLPLDVPRGQLAIVGDCNGACTCPTACHLNAVKLTPWNPIERTRGGRALPHQGRLPAPAARHPASALLDAQRRRATAQLYAEWRGGAGVLVRLPRAGRGVPEPHLVPAARRDAHDGPRGRPAHELRAGVPRRQAATSRASTWRPNDATIDLGRRHARRPQRRGHLHRDASSRCPSGRACARSSAARPPSPERPSPDYGVGASSYRNW